MLPAFGDYHHAKNLKDYWISSRDIDDQKFLGDLTGHTQQKVVVSDATFLWWLSLCKKSKISTDSFQRYWWSKNTVTLLVQSILGHHWRSRLFANMGILQNHKEHCYASLLG